MSAIISGGQKLIDSTVAHAKHYSKELSDYNLLQKISFIYILCNVNKKLITKN